MEIIIAWQACDLPDEIIEGMEHLHDQGNFLLKLTSTKVENGEIDGT